MNLKEEIIELSKKYDIDIIGFTDLSFSKAEKERMNELKEKGYLTPFYKEYNERDFEEYNTAIVIGVSYYNEMIETIDSTPNNKVYFSMSSWGEDYHKVLTRKLEPIKEYLEKLNYKANIFVDNNSLNERSLAIKAGIGFRGINNNVINDELGSYFFIGVLLTDAFIPKDAPLNRSCLTCMSCVNECPAEALDEDGKLNGNKCISYLTQKKELSEQEEKLLGKCIYGCDICSRVCPHNSNLKNSTNFIPLGIEFIDINEYNPLSNKEFNEKYGRLSGAWRGKKVIERNIDIYKEKLEKEKTK